MAIIASNYCSYWHNAISIHALSTLHYQYSASVCSSGNFPAQYRNGTGVGAIFRSGSNQYQDRINSKFGLLVVTRCLLEVGNVRTQGKWREHKQGSLLRPVCYVAGRRNHATTIIHVHAAQLLLPGRELIPSWYASISQCKQTNVDY